MGSLHVAEAWNDTLKVANYSIQGALSVSLLELVQDHGEVLTSRTEVNVRGLLAWHTSHTGADVVEPPSLDDGLEQHAWQAEETNVESQTGCLLLWHLELLLLLPLVVVCWIFQPDRLPVPDQRVVHLLPVPGSDGSPQILGLYFRESTIAAQVDPDGVIIVQDLVLCLLSEPEIPVR